MITLQSQRFGTIERPEESMLEFSGGIFGFELSRRWLLLGDSAHGALYWLQSVDQTELSFPVVEPRELIHDYALKLNARQLGAPWLQDETSLLVFAALTPMDDRMALNLREPLVIHTGLRQGRQVTAIGEPLRYALPEQSVAFKKAA